MPEEKSKREKTAKRKKKRSRKKKPRASEPIVKQLQKRIAELEAENSRLKATEPSTNLSKELWTITQKVDAHLEFFSFQFPLMDNGIIRILVKASRGVHDVWRKFHTFNGVDDAHTPSDGIRPCSDLEITYESSDLQGEVEATIEKVDAQLEFLKKQRPFIDEKIIDMLVEVSEGLDGVAGKFSFAFYDYEDILGNVENYETFFDMCKKVAELKEGTLEVSDMDGELLHFAVELRDWPAVESFSNKKKNYKYDWPRLLTSIYPEYYEVGGTDSAAGLFRVLLKDESFDPNEMFQHYPGNPHTTLLIASLHHEDWKAARILVNSPKVDVNLYPDGKPPLHHVIDFMDDDGPWVPGLNELFKALLSRKDININATESKDGLTPFFYAMIENNYYSAEELLADSRILPGIVPHLRTRYRDFGFRNTSVIPKNIFHALLRICGIEENHSLIARTFWSVVHHFVDLERASFIKGTHFNEMTARRWYWRLRRTKFPKIVSFFLFSYDILNATL